MELIVLFGALALGVLLLAGILKLLVVLLLLPFKLAWWTAKGLIGLLLFLPVLVVGFLVVTNVFPLVLMLLLLPVLLVVAAVGLFVKLLFC